MEEKKGTIKLNRTWNAIRNMLAGIGNKFVTLLFPFILRTVMIQVMGIEYAGLNGLFVSILEVLNLSELGLGTAIVYCMYKPIALGDTETICALLNLFRKIYIVIGTVILGLGLAIMPFLNVFIKGSYPSEINLYVLYSIYLFHSCMSYFFMGYRSSILSAHQRLDVIQNISTVVKAVMYIIQIGILILCRNYYIYIIMLPVATVIINCITSYEAKKIFPKYICKGQVSEYVKNDLKEKVMGLMITKLCAVTRNSFDSIFTSAFIGLSMSAIYSNYYFIMHSVISVLSIIVQAVLAGVGNSIQTETIEQNYNDLKRFNFMYLWISGVCTVCLLCLYQPFMLFWMKEENMLPFSSVILFCMYFFLLTMGDMQSIYYNAAGLWWYYRKCTIIEAILNLILNFVFVQIWGLNGVIAGTLSSLFIVNFVYSERLVFKYYFKNGKTFEFYMLQIKYAVVTGITCLAAYLVCRQIPYHDKRSSIISIIIRGVLCVVIANALFYLNYRKSYEYKSAKMWVKEKAKNIF